MGDLECLAMEWPVKNAAESSSSQTLVFSVSPKGRSDIQKSSDDSYQNGSFCLHASSWTFKSLMKQSLIEEESQEGYPPFNIF